MAINTSYSSPKVEMRNSLINGRGLFAKELIKKEEIIIDFEGGNGRYINSIEADKLFQQGFDYFIQIDDDLYFAATVEGEIENEDHINHSCNPNCGVKDKFRIVAMRDILPHEEVTFDYAMSESSNYEINCNCGSENCRKLITGDDWKLPELQKKYKGFFSKYLQRKIFK